VHLAVRTRLDCQLQSNKRVLEMNVRPRAVGHCKSPSSCRGCRRVTPYPSLARRTDVSCNFGDIELRSEDLREVLQSEFHTQMSHSGFRRKIWV